MKMNSDDKFNVVISYKTSALLCRSDLKSLIGVDLPASAAALAPSLLSDTPRVFNSSGRPGISSASPAMPPAPPLGSFGSSGDKAASAPGLSAAAFAAPPRGGGRFHGGGSFRGGDSFHGGGSFRGGGLRGGNLGSLGGEYKAKVFTVYSRIQVQSPFPSSPS
jgi:hypothetical protein